MHVHLTSQSSPRSYIEGFTLNTADYAFRSVKYAKVTIDAGFTTVRNLGDDGTITKSLRDAIAQGLVQGPRIFTAGKSLATTGGHADPSNGHRDDIMGDPHAKDGVVNGAAEARKAVRQRYKEGADLIKITATGGVLSTAKSGQNPQFMDDELEAIMAAAKDYGFKVAAHAHGAEGMKRAIKAGINSIEHGTLMDDETRSLMKKHGTYLVPTILAGEFVAEKAKIDGYFPEIVRPKAAAIGPQLKANFAKAIKAGVKIAFGTDSGVSNHGDNAQEFKLMVDNGMSPMQAIITATVNAADLLGESENLGSLSIGKYGDIVAVKGNPLENIQLLENINFVMKGGVVVKTD
jgi:imidazolonepropionase-like amidohydrolase